MKSDTAQGEEHKSQLNKKPRTSLRALEVGKAPEYFLIGDVKEEAKLKFELCKKTCIEYTISCIKEKHVLLEFTISLEAASPVLVTGSSGYLGSALVEVFQCHGIACAGIDLGASRTTQFLACISDFGALKRAAKSTGCKSIIHCAALHAPNLDFYSKSDYERVNVQGTQNVLALAGEMHMKGVVFSSTTSLMNTVEVKFRSTSETIVQVASLDYGTPRNIYGVTKKTAEMLCLQEKGTNVAILRCSRFFAEDAYDTGAAQSDRNIERSNGNIKMNELLCGTRASLADMMMAHVVSLAKICKAPQGDNGRILLGPLVVSAVSPLLDSVELGVQLSSVQDSQLYKTLGWTIPNHIGRLLDSRETWTQLGWTPMWNFDRSVHEFKSGHNVAAIQTGYW